MSAVAGLVTGVLVYFGTRFLDTAIVWGLITFIAVIVVIATLDLSFKPDDQDPNRPRLR